ncbi:MAG: hypothetical protein AB7K36_30870 [Chloroflexota bacterium]
MRKTIYLPEDLASHVDEYLRVHRDQTFSSLVQQALEREVQFYRRPSILDLAGLVDVEPDNIDLEFTDRPEDSVMFRAESHDI